jgi:uridine monophosphate synthetase
MSDTTPAKDPLLDALWEKGLILIGERVQREYALRTPIFIDLRHKLYDDLELLEQLAGALHRELCRILDVSFSPFVPPQQVIGIPDTATPIALSLALIARKTVLPVSYGQLRKKPATYPGGESGTSSYMGTRDKTREITLIDDVMASGRTKLRAIDELKKDGLEVARVLVVVDREQGGDRALEERGCPVHSLYKISELIEYYRATRRIDDTAAAAALEHVRAKQFP